MLLVVYNYSPARNVTGLVSCELVRPLTRASPPSSKSRHCRPFVERSADAEAEDEEAGVDREENAQGEDEEHQREERAASAGLRSAASAGRNIDGSSTP